MTTGLVEGTNNFGEKRYLIPRRSCLRILASFPMEVKIRDKCENKITKIYGQTTNIGENGLSFFVDKFPLPSPVELKINLAPFSPRLDAKANMIWCSQLKEKAFRCKYGVCFDEITGEERHKIKEIINDVIKESKIFYSCNLSDRRYPPVRIRPAQKSDIDGLMRVENEAWPEGLRATKEMLISRIETFPLGFLCAEVKGEIRGFACTEIVNYDIERDLYSWYEITDNGFIKKSHDLFGDTLYGVTLTVVDRGRNRLAASLLDAKKMLVVRLGLRRALLGCRIPCYSKFADKMSVDEYLSSKFLTGNSIDPEFELYQSMGGKFIKVIPNYIDDVSSLNYGVLIGWENPFA